MSLTYNQVIQTQQPTTNQALQLTPKALFEYKKTLADTKTLEQRLNDDLDETRSVKSEFDYATKKKFIDIMSQQRARKNFKAPTLADLGTGIAKEDEKATTFSKKTGLSMRSGRNLEPLATKNDSIGDANPPPILEHPAEEPSAPEASGEAKPQHKCLECSQVLSDDEVTINQRFIDQALTDSSPAPGKIDISALPLCAKCHFE